MAQWIARWTSDPEVVGSSPTLIDFFSVCFVGGIRLPIFFGRLYFCLSECVKAMIEYLD